MYLAQAQKLLLAITARSGLSTLGTRVVFLPVFSAPGERL